MWHKSPLLIAMRNTFSDSSSPLSHAYPPRAYQVFISHRGEDTKQNTASYLYHNLRRRGYSVFLDKYSIRGGEPIRDSIRHAIRSTSVHIVIFSPRFAESEWCLDELVWMLETRAPIVPVFCGVEPSEVRLQEEDGAYVRAFRVHKQCGKFDTHTHSRNGKRLCATFQIEKALLIRGNRMFPQVCF